MKLSSIINEEIIACHLKGVDRAELYNQMVSKASRVLELNLNVPKVVDALIEREDAIGIQGEGFALPHVRLPELDDLHIIIGMLDEPIMLKEDDLAPTRFIFMSLISDTTSALYLRAIAALTRYFCNPAHQNEFASCKTPAEVMTFLKNSGIILKKTISADDLINHNCPVIHENDQLRTALDIYNRENLRILPVVDDQNRLIGKLDATDILRKFIPDFIFLMDNLNFLTSLEVFEEIFNAEEELKVRDCMSQVVGIAEDTPLIQVAVRLARREDAVFFVVDKDKRVLGSLSIKDIIHKVLRG